MEYEVLRTCESGHVMAPHVRVASHTRGTIQARQESDPVRNRTVLVARLLPASGYRPIPALFDATFLGTSGERWIVAGFERIQTGPLAREHAVGQSWLIEPAPVQDLINAETRVSLLSREAHELRQQLLAMSGVSQGKTSG